LLWAWGCVWSLISNTMVSAAVPVMLIVCGMLVNGPYALITTAVSADLVSGPPRGARAALAAWSWPLSPSSFPPIPLPLSCPIGTRPSESFRTHHSPLSSHPQVPVTTLPEKALSLVLLHVAAQLRPPCSAFSSQGTHKSLQGNAKALSTVTAIIDGTGSIGL
jgi:hypothetical protein